MKTYTFVGSLSTRESVFCSKDGDLAIEKEGRRLVDPTPEETAEIYKKMSHLIPVKEAGS